MRLGDTVQALKSILDEGEEVAREGDLGDVIEEETGEAWALVFWQRAGRVMGTLPEEVVVLCEIDFATRPETTPKRKRESAVRRNVQ